MVSEPYLLLVKFDAVLCLDVCDEHGNADLCCGFLDVVSRPDGIVLLREAKEIFLLGVIGDVLVDSCKFGQSLVCRERVVRGD